MRTLAKIHSAFAVREEEDSKGSGRPVGDEDGVSTGSLNVLLSALIILLLSFSLVLMLTFSMVASAYGHNEDGVGRSLRTVHRQAVLALDEGRYHDALSGLLEVHAQNPDNCNILYQIGRCFLYGMAQPELAIPYLRRATAHMTDVYDRWDIDQRSAPYLALYDLGKALETDGEYSGAKACYVMFMGHLRPGKGTEPRRLYTAVVRGIEACERAMSGPEPEGMDLTAIEQ